MDCAEFKEFVHVYIDGEFAEHERGEADAHLASCDECRARARFEADFRSAVREAAARATPRAPETLRARIAERLGAEQPGFEGLGSEPGAADDPLAERPAPTPAPSRRFQWRWAYAPIPAAAAAAAAGLVLYAGAARENPITRAAVRQHVQFGGLGLPLDFQCTSAASCAEWARNKVGINARLPAFTAGMMPVGVRFTDMRERPAAHVAYYAAPGHRASLIVFRDDNDGPVVGRPLEVGGRQVFLSTEAGFNVAQWKNDEVVYSLVSDLDEQDILHLVSSAQER